MLGRAADGRVRDGWDHGSSWTPLPALRMSRTALLPVGLLALCVRPAGLRARPWTLVLLLVPPGGRALGAAGRRATSPTTALHRCARWPAQRRVPWTELAGIRVAARGDLWLVTTGGTEVRLPVMRARDLPRLAALSGGRIDVPAPPAGVSSGRRR